MRATVSVRLDRHTQLAVTSHTSLDMKTGLKKATEHYCLDSSSKGLSAFWLGEPSEKVNMKLDRLNRFWMNDCSDTFRCNPLLALVFLINQSIYLGRYELIDSPYFSSNCEAFILK